MSSFKKLRLDPETPVQGTHRNLSNQPGANDGGGRSYMDNSSFSSSTSGGSGTYARSAGPFRTRYSQPLRIPSPSSGFSRFAPYYFGKERRSTLRVPLIRARRDESESDTYRPASRASLNSSLGGDSTSSANNSTAQRIIETLQNISTPVMNAGKIRIDQDIKAVQPLPFGSGSSLSRFSPGSPMNRSSGPPKMCSSLLLSTPSSANQISPVSNIGDQRRLFCIPKMIDAATNTEKEAETTSPSQIHKSYRTGIDFKTSVPTATSKNIYGGSSGPASKSVATTRDDNSDDEYHECSSDFTFTFSAAWSPQIFDRYFTSDKDDKSGEKRTLPTGQQQPSILNGYKEPTPSTSASMFSGPNKSTISFSSSNSPMSASAPKPAAGPGSSNFSSFSGSGQQFGFGSSPSPMKSALSSQAKQTESSSDSKQSTSGPQDSSLSGTKSIPATTLPSFKFGSPISTEGPIPKKTTFSFGKDSSKEDKQADTTSFDNVDAAKNDKKSANSAATATLPPLTAKDSGSKWSCPTCLVKNEMSAQVCVCCGEKQNPKPTADTKLPLPGFGPASVPINKKWRCPTCMVDNEVGVAACVCCSEKNPNAVAAPTPTPAAMKWRCTTCMVQNDSTASVCVCCSEKNPSYSGEKKDEALSSSASTSTFKFGISASTGAGVTSDQTLGNSTFVFGQTAPTEKPALSTFKFGAPSTTSSVSTVASSAPSVAPAVPAVTTSVPSITLSSQTINTNSPFKFSGTAPVTLPSSTPSFGFSSSLSSTGPPPATTNVPTTTTPVFATSKPISATFNNTPIPTPPAPNSIFGSANFQSASSVSQPASSPSFTTISQAPTGNPPKVTTSFASFGSAGAKSTFGTFSFGSSSAQPPGTAQSAAATSILSPNPQISNTAPASSIGSAPGFSFGSNNSSATSTFGQIQSPPTNPTSQPPSGIFQFGGSATPNRNLNPSPAPAPAPSFSLTPNLNFGSTPSSSIPSFGNPSQPTPNAGSQPPPALFQFAATPSESPGARKIKRAVRRFNK